IFGINPNGLQSTATVGGFAGNFLAGGAVSLLPALLGVGLGAGVGGQSGLGRILGGIGGGAVGLGLSFGASVFGASGLLGPSLLAALGPAALIGAPLLVAALLLGRAAARRRDEATSGDSLQNAINAIHALTKSANRGELTSVSEAEKQFKQIYDQLKTETLALKTKSVRESRLAHQLDPTGARPDSIRHLFNTETLP